MPKKPVPNVEMVDYLGRAVPKKHFRTFIYNSLNEKKLVCNWNEYQDLIASGIWFAEPVKEQEFEEMSTVATAQEESELEVKPKNGKK